MTKTKVKVEEIHFRSFQEFEHKCNAYNGKFLSVLDKRENSIEPSPAFINQALMHSYTFICLFEVTEFI